MNPNKKELQESTEFAKLFVGIAKLMPEEKILTDLEEAIVEYRKDKNEESKKKLLMFLQFASLRYMDEEKSLEDSMGDVDRVAGIMKREQLLNT